jgi:CP family cyanate transporter-like MFS transporter
VWLFVVVIAIVGLNIRAALGSVPPLLPDIRVELGISNTEAGLITSLAVLSIGLFAPVGQRLGARIGAEAATAWFLGVLCVAQLARLIPAGTILLLATTMVTGAAMGAASSMIPALISEHGRGARGLVMGVYSTGMALGIAAAAGLAVPLERAFDGWRASLASWGFFAGLALIVWLAVMVRGRRSSRNPSSIGVDHRLPWASPVARLVTLFFATQMVVGYGCMAWLAPLYVSLGKSPETAAGLFVVFQVVQLATMVGLPALTDRTTDRRPLIAFAVTCNCTGLALLLVAPLPLALPAVALAGLGAGGGATLALILVIDTTSTVGDGSRLTAMLLLVGNAVGALAPLALGAIKDLTGGFGPGIAILLTVAGTTLVVVVPRFRPDLRLETRSPSPTVTD